MTGRSSAAIVLTAVQQGGSRGVELWATDPSGNLWTKYEVTPGGPWSGWEGPAFKGQPAKAWKAAAALRGDGNVQLFMLDRDGLTWTIAQYAPGGDWGAWQGPRFGGQPVGFLDVTAAGVDGGIQLWALDAQGSVWTTYQTTPGADWSAWEQFGGLSVPFQRLAAAGQNTGAAMLVGLDANHQLWSIAQSGPASPWGPWTGPGIGGQSVELHEVAAAQQSGNRGIELWGVASDGSIWTLWQITPGGAWSVWEGPGFKDQPQPARAIAAADQNTGNVMVFARNADNTLGTISQLSSGGDWGAWSGLDSFAGTDENLPDDLMASVVGYFPFDGSPEDPLAAPATAVLTGRMTFVPAWGSRDALLASDATGGCAFPTLTMPSGVSGATLAFWFGQTGTFSNVPVLYTDPHGFQVRLRSDGGLSCGLNGTPTVEIPATTLQTGAWNHLALAVEQVGGSGYVFNIWVNGIRRSSTIGGTPISPGGMFATHAIGTGPDSTAGVALSGYVMLSGSIGDDEAMYIASDLFHPEATHAAEIEYLAARLDGATEITCPDGPQLALDHGYTVTTWISTELLSYRLYPYSSTEQVLFEASGRCRFFFDGQGRLTGRYWTSSGPAQLSVDTATLFVDRFDWVHLTFTYDPVQGASLYVNAEAVTNAQQTQPATTTPAAPVTIGLNLQQGIYGVSVYGQPLTADQVTDDYSVDVPTQGLPASCLVYYDLSAVPPTALSSVAALSGPLNAPATMVYDVYSVGVAVAGGGYVDCGYDADALIPAGSSLSVDAWIYPTSELGTGTVLARNDAGHGFRVFLQDATLGAEMRGPQPWQALIALTDIPLPTGEWSRVGVVFTNEVSSGMSLSLYLNGRALTTVNRPTPPGTPEGSIASPTSRLLVGAQSDDGGAGVTRPFDGLVQRVRFYNGAVAFDGLFTGPDWTPGDLVSDWFLGDDFPRDLTDDEPATLMAGASVDTVSWSGSPNGIGGLARHRVERQTAFCERLFPSENFANLWDQIRPEHQSALLTTPETAGRVVAVTLDDANYLLAHGPTVGEAPTCHRIGALDDPTNDWVGFMLEVISLGLAVWGLRAGSPDKLAKTGLSLWRDQSVRQAVIAMTAIGGPAEVPDVVIALMRTIYSSGFISRLLSCYTLSIFAILRFAAMFAPWAAWALIAYDLAKIALRIWDLVEPQKPKQRPSAVNASCAKPLDLTGRVPVLVNGDPVAVNVALLPPPQTPVSVTASSGPLDVNPRTINFPAGSGPVQVSVSAAGVEAAIEDRMPVAVTWSGAGVVGQAVVQFSVRVLDLTLEPAEPELRYNAEQDAWVGDFTVETGPEMASGSTLEVTLSADSDGQEELTFNPSVVTFASTQPSAVSGPGPQTVAATWKNPPAGKNKRTFAMMGKTTPQGKAGDGVRRSPRLKKTEQYRANLAMVDADRGLSMVLQCVAADGSARYAVIDGGITGTYANLAQYLPQPGSPIDYVVCTHYDDDHIGGLIVLLTQRGNDVGRVVFNPPPGAAACPAFVMPLLAGQVAAEELPSLLEGVSAAKDGFLNVYSPPQGNCLKYLAGAKLLPPITALPPPATSVPNVALPRTSWLFGGPSPQNLARMQGNPYNGLWTNRASLMFQLTGLDDTNNPAPALFSLLVTGDGTNRGTIQDVVGVQPGLDGVQFLQVPHHGSRNNSDITLYARVPAQHYLISSRWSPHHHPRAKVIRSIVEGNRWMGRTGYTIWITDPTFKKAGDNDGQLDAQYDGFFPRPLGNEYTVKLKAPNITGLVFQVTDGQITPPAPGQWTLLPITPL